MAKSKTAAKEAQTSGKQKRLSTDAIELLKADHEQVAEWFEEFEESDDETEKADLAEKICSALKVHATIEEEIFYPAFLDLTGDLDMHHEAEVEHKSAKRLIADIEEGGPEDEYFDANVKVLSEMIKHHVEEEEQADGMFEEARKAGMDMAAIGAEMLERKTELEIEEGAVSGEDE